MLMIKNCSFNDYHRDFVHEVETSLLHISTCQSKVISSLVSPSSITKEDFVRQIIDLEEAYNSIILSLIDF